MMAIDRIFSLKYQPPLIRHTLQSCLNSHEVVSFVLAYLDKTVALRRGPCCYRYDTQDFGVQIDRLEIGQVLDPENRMLQLAAYDMGEGWNCFDNHAYQLAMHFGFAIKMRIVTGNPYIRDWLYPLNGRMVKPDNADVYQAWARISLAAFANRFHPRSQTKHPLYQKICGVGFLEEVSNPSIVVRGPQTNVQKADFYFEGGNVFVVTNPKNPGQKLCLIGRNGFMLALLQLRSSGFFDDNRYLTKARFQALVDEIERKLTPEMRSAHLLEMRQHLVIVEDHQPEALKADKMPKDVVACQQYVLELAKIDLPPKDKAVAQYVVQKEILRALIGLQFGLSDKFDLKVADDIVIIEPLNYHLDTFICPGPKSSFFVQNYELGLDFLNRLKVHAKRFNLTADDLKILDRLIAAAEDHHKKLGHIVAKIEDQLNKAGFTVIPAPGVFYDQEKDYHPEYGANFFNSVTGYSAKTKRYYYMALGIKIGQNLGEALMKMWEAFLKQYQTGVDVHYLGDDGSFEETTQFWSMLGAGFHCKSLATIRQSRLEDPAVTS